MLDVFKSLFGGKTDFGALIEKGAKIIDVRTAAEFQQGHVKGSVNIPLDKITANIDRIKKMNAPIITCCASGMRSSTASSVLKNKGIEVYNGGSWTSLRKFGK